MSETCRHLVIVLGDQLDDSSAAFDAFAPSNDIVWLAEVASESEHVWSHKARIALFLSAMRHFRDRLDDDITVRYTALDDEDNQGSFGAQIQADIEDLQPERLIVVKPGEWRVERELLEAAAQVGVELEIRPDRHFLLSPEEFEHHAEGRKQLRMEYFYREMRRKFEVLMDGDDPAGGAWNYDAENRETFGADGPGDIPEPAGFEPDAMTAEVFDLVEEHFGDHPGSLQQFDWPVTAEQAREALDDFIANRLPLFGDFQDAVWAREPYLYHSRLSAAMNLKLLDPREVITAAEEAWQQDHAPINSVEGFIRQILGWREFIRGIYWYAMPEYAGENFFEAEGDLPELYWTAGTDMNCLRLTVGQTLDYGFAHHIQRLMVTGLFALLVGVEPKQVHRWYLAVYVDAVEWVELPNVIGMSQFADGGLMASKPYVASGSYIDRMSNYCTECRYKPEKKTGEEAYPFTVLYWDFLMQHRPILEEIPRMGLQIRNIDRMDEQTQDNITQRAQDIRERLSR